MLLLRRRENLRDGCAVVAGMLLVGTLGSMLPDTLARPSGGDVPACLQLAVSEHLRLALRLDALGLCFGLVSASLWVVTTFYGAGYMRGLQEHARTRFGVFFAVAIAAAIGVACSANLLTLYLFYEVLSLSTYPLVTHHGDAAARAAGRRYLGYLLGASILLALPAILVTYAHDPATGWKLEFVAGGLLRGVNLAAGLPVLLLFLFVYGFAKCGLMPLHGWLPAAMVAPTPVSALLHAVAVVKVGVFAVLRVLHFVFGPGLLAQHGLGTTLAWVACVTILVGSCIALVQDNLKRRLAYSTISQLSYIVLAGALVTTGGTAGQATVAGALHIAMHAFGKITLFFCAGAILVASGRKNISQLDGIGRRMPWTMTAFFLGSLSIIGLPPTGGFLTKWFLAGGALEADQLPIVGVLLLSSLLNAAYFLPIVGRAFFAPPADPEADRQVREAPLACLLPLLFTAGASVALFFLPEPFLSLARTLASGGP
jgi:multicomponent Na+:H+ antiporter subunit D